MQRLKSHSPEINEGLEFCSCACDTEILIALEKQELKLAHSNCKYNLIIIVSVISCNSFPSYCNIFVSIFYVGSQLLFTYSDVTRKHYKVSETIFLQ